MSLKRKTYDDQYITIDLNKINKRITEGQYTTTLHESYSDLNNIQTRETILINNSCKICDPCIMCLLRKSESGTLPHDCDSRSDLFKDILLEFHYFYVNDKNEKETNYIIEQPILTEMKSNQILNDLDDLNIIKQKIFFGYVIGLKQNLIEFIKKRRRDLMYLNIEQENKIDEFIKLYISLKYIKTKIHQFIHDRVEALNLYNDSELLL